MEYDRYLRPRQRVCGNQSQLLPTVAGQVHAIFERQSHRCKLLLEKCNYGKHWLDQPLRTGTLEGVGVYAVTIVYVSL